MAERRPGFVPAIWCLVAALLFGATTPASKALVYDLGPLLLSGLLYLGAALAVVIPATRAMRRREHRGLRGGDRTRLLGAVVCGGVIGPVLLLLALSRAPASSVSLWLTLETVATAILARAFFNEYLGTRAWLATGLVVIASVVISDPAQGGLVATGLVALACIAWGLDNNFTSVIEGLTTAEITFWKGLVAGATTLIAGLALGARASAVEVGAALAIGALGYGASLVLYVAGAQQLGATRSQLVFSTAPLFGVAVATLFFGEIVGGQHAVAIGLMASAIWLLSRDVHTHAHRHETIVHTHWHRGGDGHHDHAHPGEGAEAPSSRAWHQHEHRHDAVVHAHPHWPDLHHRHPHKDEPEPE